MDNGSADKLQVNGEKAGIAGVVPSVMDPRGERAKIDLAAQLAEIAKLATQFDVFRFIKQFTLSIGMKGFMVSRMPTQAKYQLSETSIITNWPPELISSFDGHKLIKGSPVIRQLSNSTVPFTFDVDVLYAQKADGRSVMAQDLFRHAGLSRGVVFPVADASGERGVIILAGERANPDMVEISCWMLVMTHVHDRLFQIRQKDAKVIDTLTDREIDCLTWTAAGKTSAEIAEIIGLSEHTVNHYLNRAAKKLDTVNRTQAVAKALRAGIIR